MKKLMFLSLAALLMASASSLSFAAGGNSGGAGGGNPAEPEKKCKKGEVLKKVGNVKKCVKVESGILPDEDLYQQGRALAKAGEYEWALQVLAAIENQN
ncbi:MAG TPA: hypothetical protein PLL12_14465, partial [Aestuariivirga sp.]|nr:hypothetical protein [Aestuariivirga sp.]